MLPVTWTIPGRPRPQGSAKWIPGRGTGRPVPVKNQAEVQHRAYVTAFLAAAHDAPPLDVPLAASVSFTFTRPKSHYRTGRNAGLLKPSAPRFHAQPPDLDKLLRLLGDALTIAGVITDDGLLVAWTATRRWAEPGEAEATTVTLSPA